MTARDVITQAIRNDGQSLGDSSRMADFILRALKDAGYAFLRAWDKTEDGELEVIVLNEKTAVAPASDPPEYGAIWPQPHADRDVQ